MNEKIIIQEPDETRGSTLGQIKPNYTTHFDCWAEVKHLSGSERFTSDMTIYSDVKEFKVHYHEAQNVTSDMRIYWDSKYYQITAINPDKKKVYIFLIAVASDDD